MTGRVLALVRSAHGLAVAAQAGGAALGFAAFVLLARALGLEAFGAWVLLLSTAALLDMLRSGLVQTGLVQMTSGTGPEDEASYAGAAWLLGGLATIVTAGAVVLLGHLVEPGAFALFFAWYPLLAAATLPARIAEWRMQAASRFGRILALRLVPAAAFAAWVGARYVQGGLAAGEAAAAYVAVHGAASLGAALLGWAAPFSVLRTSREALKALWGFGRYSVGTLVGSNLLRSADGLLIGVWLGPAAVALYAVAQRLVEVVEVPLRGLAQASLPVFSRAARAGDHGAVAASLRRWAGGLTLALLPFLGLVLVFAPALVTLVGGAGYEGAAPLLRVFVVYMALLPLDRYLGLALDALGQPRLNALKVGAMAALNVVGDVLALALWGSLLAVAGVTILMTLAGVALGLLFVNRSLKTGRVRPGGVARAGWQTVRQAWTHLRPV